MQSKARRFLYRDNTIGYAFISLWLIGFVAFTIMPMLVSLFLSFNQYDGLSAPVWKGLANYIDMFTKDPRFWTAFSNTLFYVVIYVPLRLAFALGVAILFTKQSRMTSVYRTVYYLPSIIGGSMAVAVMWRSIFGSQGLINKILIGMNLITRPTSWINWPTTAMLTLIVLAVWQFGSPMLIFMAGLKEIPRSLYEAAEVDGANWGQRFRKITMPMLTPVLFFNLVMQAISGFLTFTQAYVITQGGPNDKTLLYVLYMFNNSFLYGKMGYGSAMAWFLLLFMSLVTFLLFKSSSAWVYYESASE